MNEILGALKDLEILTYDLKTKLNVDNDMYEHFKNCVETLKASNERKEKLEKAWEIVKEKNPRISLIKSMIKTNSVDFVTYNMAVFDYERLTETEFNNLLKGMILDDKK